MKLTGRRVKAGHLDVRVTLSPLSYSRAGIIVPKFGRSIVERNKLRRRLRELVRTKMLPSLALQPESRDVVIRTYPKAYEMSFDELAREIDRLVTRVLARVA